MGYQDNAGTDHATKEEADYQTAVNQSQGIGAGRGSVYTGPSSVGRGGGDGGYGFDVAGGVNSALSGATSALKAKNEAWEREDRRKRQEAKRYYNTGRLYLIKVIMTKQ